MPARVTRLIMAKQVSTNAWTPLVALIMGLCMVAGATTRTDAQASVASDELAGYLVFPKVVSDPTDMFRQGRAVDTLIKLTNKSSQTRAVHCIYVNATGFCSNGANSFSPDGYCRSNRDCLPGGTCDVDWRGLQDFSVVLSPGQPTGWRVSAGTTIPRATTIGEGAVNPIPLDYFIGELKCFQVDGDSIAGSGLLPLNANDLKGEATIYELTSGIPGSVDVRSYGAIGVQAVLDNDSVQSDRVMCLGDTAGSAECATAEYAACPGRMILDHYFDGAILVSEGGVTRVTTDLTLVPCSENIASPPDQVAGLVQFLVFNEFEQRMSGSTEVDCFLEVPLSNLDRRPGQELSSIFNVAVQGTLGGQTVIRPVPENETDRGSGMLGIAEEFHLAVFDSGARPTSAAFHLNYVGESTGSGDFVRYDVPLPDDN